jgi:hypothetical protein
MAKGTTSDSFLIARAMDSAVYLRNDPCKLCSLATVGYLACARAFLIQKPFKMYSPVSFSPAQVCDATPSSYSESSMTQERPPRVAVLLKTLG